MKQKRINFFFSGEIPVERFMFTRPEEFKNMGVLLSFYTLRTSKRGRPTRRLEAIIKGERYKETGKKRTKDSKVEERPKKRRRYKKKGHKVEAKAFPPLLEM